MSEVPLRELAQVIRSKNAGPFELTFDIIFDRQAAYEEVKKSVLDGLSSLSGSLGKSFVDLPPEQRINKLKSMEGTDFFRLVYAETLRGLYDNDESWKLLGLRQVVGDEKTISHLTPLRQYTP